MILLFFIMDVTPEINHLNLLSKPTLPVFCRKTHLHRPPFDKLLKPRSSSQHKAGNRKGCVWKGSKKTKNFKGLCKHTAILL